MATSKEIEQTKENFADAADELHWLAYELDTYNDRDMLDSKSDLDEVPAIVDKMRNHLQVVLMSAHFLRQELNK